MQALKLIGGLDVEAVHADFQGAAHVFTGFANAGKDDFAQGGGTEPKLIDQALTEITKVTTGKIS
mgnify:CR=1 FL=1